MAKLQKLHYNDPLVIIKVNDSNKRQKEVEWSLNCTRALSLGFCSAGQAEDDGMMGQGLKVSPPLNSE